MNVVYMTTQMNIVNTIMNDSSFYIQSDTYMPGWSRMELVCVSSYGVKSTGRELMLLSFSFAINCLIIKDIFCSRIILFNPVPSFLRCLPYNVYFY